MKPLRVGWEGRTDTVRYGSWAMVNARLLHSLRGPHGGYMLAKPANKITVVEVIEAAEGPLLRVSDLGTAREGTLAHGLSVSVHWISGHRMCLVRSVHTGWCGTAGRRRSETRLSALLPWGAAGREFPHRERE